MAGRSPQEAIFLWDPALHMNPYEMMVASVDVQGAFPHAPHRLFTDVWDAMGLRFLPFMTAYIQTLLYAVITDAGSTPLTGTDSEVPQDCAEVPLLYLLVTLPPAFELARVYPGNAPHPLRFPIIYFAGDNLRTTATRHRDPAYGGLPTTIDQACAIMKLTTTYLDAYHLLVHPRKSVGLADVGTPAPHIRKGEPLHLADTLFHPGGQTGHTASQHRTPKQAGRAPRPITQTCQVGPPVYAGPAILHGGGYQALHLPDPQEALQHAHQQVTKAWARRGG